MPSQKVLSLIGAFCLSYTSFAQTDVIEIGETMEEYIQENHVQAIEDMIHQFTTSKTFLNYLLEQGHNINPETIVLKRKDVSVGKDIDIYVKHLTEHQNFTMVMVPVDIYPKAIYDTLLFAVLEVSDVWLKEKYYRYDLEDPEIKARLLAEETHAMLTEHMFNQVMASNRKSLVEVEIKLHESYISSGSVQIHTNELDAEERQRLLKSWGLIKRAFTHDIALNIEMNIYIFGHDDMRVVEYTSEGKVEHVITPGNIFIRHHFQEDTE